jgi:ABC-2 type transport system permease protein
MKTTDIPELFPTLGAGPPDAPSLPRLPLTAGWAVFWLTVRQQCRARRLFILAALFLLPAAIAVVVRSTDTLSGRNLKIGFAYALIPRTPISVIGLMEIDRMVRLVRELQFSLVFTLIPHALVPLAALLYASGMICDEIEDQTLTYLVIRPLPKWVIYVAKFLATFVVTATLAAFFTLVTYLAIYGRLPPLSLEAAVLERAALTVVIFTLALFTYCAGFGCLSLLVKRSLVIGVAYIVLFEGVLANIGFAVRKLTVMYYVRILSERWLELSYSDWSLDLKEALSGGQCVETLLGTGLIFVVLGAWIFSTREFRVKTPEGS